jgi:S1-C subfamily serine protease
VPSSDVEIKTSYAPVVKAVVPSVVNIYDKRVVERRASPFAGDPFFSQFFGDMRARPRLQNSLGSGVVLGDQGIVVSNWHVVGIATDIRVVLSDKREFDAELVFGDPETDLAILRMRDAPDLPGLDFADSDAVEVGDLVLAVGNPFGVGQTVSSGIISASARTGQVGGRAGYFLQTDAPINPGNSGGAMVDPGFPK